MDDRLPNRNPTAAFWRMYWPGVMGSTPLTRATPSSFSEMIFIALKVQPMNIATISTAGIKMPCMLSRMSGRSRVRTSAWAAVSRWA